MLGHLEHSRGLTGVSWNLHGGKNTTPIYTMMEKSHLCFCFATLFGIQFLEPATLCAKFQTNIQNAFELSIKMIDL
jgi:hypothetical protein